jgi:hypothetical protein
MDKQAVLEIIRPALAHLRQLREQGLIPIGSEIIPDGFDRIWAEYAAIAPAVLDQLGPEGLAALTPHEREYIRYHAGRARQAASTGSKASFMHMMVYRDPGDALPGVALEQIIARLEHEIGWDKENARQIAAIEVLLTQYDDADQLMKAGMIRYSAPFALTRLQSARELTIALNRIAVGDIGGAPSVGFFLHSMGWRLPRP